MNLPWYLATGCHEPGWCHLTISRKCPGIWDCSQTLWTPWWRLTLCPILLVTSEWAAQLRQPQPAIWSSPWTGLEEKLAHKSRKGLSTETCDRTSLAGSLPFQWASLWKEISLLIVSSKVSYYYYVYFDTNVAIWDIWAVESLGFNTWM